MSVTLSLEQARSLALTAQGLRGSPFPVSPTTARTASLTRRTTAVRSVLEHCGAIQLDTISVLARSHELIPYARLGSIGRESVEAALWPSENPSHSFEYWSHAACVLPADLWPWFAFRRRFYQRRGQGWHKVPRQSLASLRRRLDDGPLTTRDIGGAKSGGEWWDWSESKIGMEWLLNIGDVVVARRVGWRRVYDLPDRTLDPRLLTQTGAGSTTWASTDGIEGPSDEECVRHLALLGARAIGIGTAVDILDVHRIGPRYTGKKHCASVLSELVADGELTEVSVQGWKAPAYADPRLLAQGSSRGRHRTALLSPFDSLVWHRGRTQRLFDFEYQLEAYVPAAKRVYGYFTMPVLHGGTLVARVDPKRDGSTLVARQVTFETSDGTGAPSGAVTQSAMEGTATSLVEAMHWVGCTTVRIERVLPTTATRPLNDRVRAALAS